MEKSYYKCIGSNFILLDKLEDKEKRQVIESICVGGDLNNYNVKATLEQIKN